MEREERRMTGDEVFGSCDSGKVEGHGGGRRGQETSRNRCRKATRQRRRITQGGGAGREAGGEDK